MRAENEVGFQFYVYIYIIYNVNAGFYCKSKTINEIPNERESD